MANFVVGRERVTLLAQLAAELYKSIPEERSTSVTESNKDAYRASRAMNVAWMILEDAEKRTAGK